MVQIKGVFRLHVQPVNQANRQAANMQGSHDSFGVRWAGTIEGGVNCIQHEGEASPVALILTHTAPDTCWWGWQDCKRIEGRMEGGVKVPYNTEYQPNTAGGGRSGKENCVQPLSGQICHRMKHIKWSQKIQWMRLCWSGMAANIRICFTPDYCSYFFKGI